MSLLHADFPSGDPGLYGTTTSLMTAAGWTIGSAGFKLNIEDDPDVEVTGNVLRFTNSFASAAIATRAINQETIGFNGRFWLTLMPTFTAENPAYQVWPIVDNAGNTRYMRLTVTEAGQLRLLMSQASLDLYSAPGIITCRGWHYIETKLFYGGFGNGGNGNIEVRLNGDVIFDENFTLLVEDPPVTPNYFNFFFQGVSIRHDSYNFGSTDFYVKDMVIWDGQGSVNNDFLGEVWTTRHIPTSDVSLNWTPSTGTTGFDLIDESPPDLADYIQADATPPAAAVMGVSNLPAYIDTVNGLIVCSYIDVSGVGAQTYRNQVESNAVVGDGATAAAALEFRRDIFENDPDTAAPWLPAAVDAARIRFDRVT